MSEQCSKRVFSDGWGGHQCMRQAITVEDGKPVCRQHTAAAKADREAKSAVRYQAYLRRVNAPYNRLRDLKATNTKLLAALEAILDVLKPDSLGYFQGDVNLLTCEHMIQAREAIKEAKGE